MAEKITKRKVYRFTIVNRESFIKTFNRLARHGYVWGATARVRTGCEALKVLRVHYGWAAIPYKIVIGDPECTRVVLDYDDYCPEEINEIVDIPIDKFIKQKLYEA